MAFDDTQPTDTTKIRDLGAVIRPNWQAIQTADSSFKPNALNFTDRTVAGLAVNPTAIADAYIMYSKTDAAGNTELYGINDTSGIIQFTRGVPLLAQAQSSIFLPGGMILKTGKVTLAASPETITFSTPFPSACFGVAMSTVGAVANALVAAPIAASFSVFGTAGDVMFWIAWGI